MHAITTNLSQLNDTTLLAAVASTAQDNRAALLQRLRYLGEVDARKLYARAGYASLFAFTQGLNFSESEAYKRCLVGRVGRRFPVLLEAIGAGELHLTGAAMIAPKMEVGNAESLLEAARYKSKRNLEASQAKMFPVHHAPHRAVVRPVCISALACVGTQQRMAADAPRAGTAASEAKDGHQQPGAGRQTQLALQPAAISAVSRPGQNGPQAIAGGTAESAGRGQSNTGTAENSGGSTGATADARRAAASGAVVAALAKKVDAEDAAPARRLAVPVAAEAYRIHVNLDAAGYALLREAQELLSHQLPHGDLGKVIESALASLVNQLKRRKHGGLKSRTTASSRVHAPSAQGTECASAPGKNSVQSGPIGTLEQNSHPVSEAMKQREQEQLHQEQLHEKQQPGKAPKTGRSRALSRMVKREVYACDAGACTYVAADGHRCGARAFLEYHHVQAFGLGGCNDADNVTLHCRAHNALAAVDDFGAAHQARAIARGQQPRHVGTEARRESAL